MRILLLCLLAAASFGANTVDTPDLGTGAVPPVAGALTGTVAIANGGTNSSTALSGSTIMISNGSAIVQGTAGTTTTLLHGNAAGAPTYGQAVLTTDVTGVLPVANGGTASSTAATARAALGVAQFDWPGMIEVPTAKTYYLIPTATTGYTFTSVTIYTVSGTATANFKIGSTSITGASAIAVTSTPQTIALSAANVAVATDTVTLVITAPVAAVDLVYNLGYTR